MGESQVVARRRHAIVTAAVAAAAVVALVAAGATSAGAMASDEFTPPATASHWPLPKQVDQLVASKDGTQLYAATDSPDVLVIDPATKAVTRTIVLPSTVSHLALTPSGRLDALDTRVATGSSAPAVYQVDPATGAVVETTPLPAGFQTSGFAITPDGTTALVAEKLDDAPTRSSAVETVTIHPDTGVVGATATVPGNVDAQDIGITPDGSKAFALSWVTSASAGRQGLLSTIDTATGQVAPPLTLGTDDESLVVSADGTRVFVADGDLRSDHSVVDVVDVATGALATSISTPRLTEGEDGALLTADGSEVVVGGDTSTTVIDPVTLATHQLKARIPAGDAVLVPGTSRVISGGATGFGEYDVATGQTVRLSYAGLDASTAVVLPGDHDLYGYSMQSPDGGGNWLTHFDLAASAGLVNMDRYSDPDQYSTDVDVLGQADEAYSGGPQFGYIVSGESAAEDLSAAAAAAHQHAEVVLTAPGALPAAIRKFEEYRSLRALFIIGGNASVSPYVRSQLVYLTRHHTVIVRVAGGDHLATSRALVREAFGTTLKHVWITTGTGSSDAFAASAAAAHRGEPVLAVNGSAATLDASTTTFLRQEKATSFTIVGSTSAVSSGVAASLARIAPVTRIAGSDPIQTSQLVNASVFPRSTWRAVFTSASAWQDQLLAVQLAAVQGAPLDFVPQNCVPDPIVEQLGSQPYATASIIGTKATLGAGVEALATC